MPPTGNDIYPNQSDTFTAEDFAAYSTETPPERTEKEKEELMEIASSAKVINDVMAWLDEQIAFYGNLDSIDVEGGTEDSLRVAMNVAKNMKSNFEAKRREFVQLYNAILKSKEQTDIQL